ncbi:MAG: cupredoxin domain-containing protein [Ferruginibacter sp.]
MKKNLFIPVIVLFLSIILAGCTKEEDFPDMGGNLPSHYITIQADGSFSPSLLKVASGSSITFVNNDSKAHNILSNDSVSIITNIIAPKSFYRFKNDTLIGMFPYKCTLDSNIRGTIIITP